MSIIFTTFSTLPFPFYRWILRHYLRGEKGEKNYENEWETEEQAKN